MWRPQNWRLLRARSRASRAGGPLPAGIEKGPTTAARTKANARERCAASTRPRPAGIAPAQPSRNPATAEEEKNYAPAVAAAGAAEPGARGAGSAAGARSCQPHEPGQQRSGAGRDGGGSTSSRRSSCNSGTAPSSSKRKGQRRRRPHARRAQATSAARRPRWSLCHWKLKEILMKHAGKSGGPGSSPRKRRPRADPDYQVTGRALRHAGQSAAFFQQLRLRCFRPSARAASW